MPAPTDTTLAPRFTSASTLGWAAYLGCSWTWCIGMFLPALLFRDYGLWSFVVFAVPNVLGAALMGFVLRDGAAERIRANHQVACAAFSIVTIVFQVFFFTWFIVRVAEDLSVHTAFSPFLILGILGVIVLLALYWPAMRQPTRRWQFTVACSALIASYFMAHVLWGGVFDIWAQFPARPVAPPADLAFLAPVCAFGFALCPYLDLTFIRARHEQPAAAARASFGLGFGGVFFSMILGTLMYAPLALLVMERTFEHSVIDGLLVCLGVHMTIQLSATIALHVDELRRLPGSAAPRSLRILALAVVAITALACLGHWKPIARFNMFQGEMVYRLFMSFYGLIFPAYVWLCMIPTRDGHSGLVGTRGRRKLAVLCAAVVLAGPCFFMGFIAREEFWLAPGLAIVLLSRLLLRGSRPGAELVSARPSPA